MVTKKEGQALYVDCTIRRKVLCITPLAAIVDRFRPISFFSASFVVSKLPSIRPTLPNSAQLLRPLLRSALRFYAAGGTSFSASQDSISRLL
jgi:hypothetical protein